jgi:hypothetical protein
VLQSVMPLTVPRVGAGTWMGSGRYSRGGAGRAGCGRRSGRAGAFVVAGWLADSGAVRAALA